MYEIVPAAAKGWMPDGRYPANRAAAGGSANEELAWLKLRYKLPQPDTSLLLEQPVRAELIRSAFAPRGDSAFAAAVAANGQKLRGDPYLGNFIFADARRLAERSGRSGDFWRGEFLRLAQLAERRAPATAAGGSAAR